MNGDFSFDPVFRDATQTATAITVPAGASTKIAGKSRSRIGLYIYGSIATVNHAFPFPMTGINQGIGFSATQPLLISQRTHGDLATEEWHCWSGAGATIVVVEVFGCPCSTGH